MFRFLYITLTLLKYSIIYVQVKLGLYKKPKEKILKNFFEDAGGSFVKFGQLLSLRVDVLPKEYSIELLDLLDNVRFFSYRDVERIFMHELGATPEKIFKDFQKQPFASASFGQVHAGKLEDNTVVAIKVMRPSIEQDVFVDFFFLDILAFFGDLFFKIEAMPWKGFADEFKKWTKEELDYHVEAENIEKMYPLQFSSKTTIYPKVYPKYSTRKILTQEYIDGIPLSRILIGLRDGRLNATKLMEMGIDIKKAPRLLVAELLRQYFYFGVFHADPHPGNILLLKNGKIGLVDFGILGTERIPNQDILIKFLIAAGSTKVKESSYYAMQFAGGDLKQMVNSIFPATIDQKYIDDFMRLLGEKFTDSMIDKVDKSLEDLNEMRVDYSLLLLQVLKEAQGYKVKLPKQLVVFVRALAIIGLMAKEMDKSFKLGGELVEFFKKNPKEKFVRSETISYKRINREVALEKLNSWLSYLFEKDPSLYRLVNNYINKYNVINRK